MIKDIKITTSQDKDVDARTQRPNWLEGTVAEVKVVLDSVTTARRLKRSLNAWYVSGNVNTRLETSGWAAKFPADLPRGDGILIVEEWGEGKSHDKVKVNVTINERVTGSTPPPLENPPENVPPTPGTVSSPATQDQYALSGKMGIGLVSLADAAYSATKDLIADFGFQYLRFWWNTNNYKSAKPSTDIKKKLAQALEYEAEGIQVLYCFAQEETTVESLELEPAWLIKAIQYIADAYDTDKRTSGKVIAVERLNEPDLVRKDGSRYFQGTLKQFATTQVTAYKAVKEHFGDRVIFVHGGFSWNIGKLEEIAPTLAQGTDAFVLHGYPDDTDDKTMDSYKRLVKLSAEYGKLSWVSEGAPGTDGEETDRKKDAAIRAGRWQKYLWKLEKFGIDRCYIFTARDGGSPNGAGAMFDKNWKLTQSGKNVLAIVKEK